MGTLGTEPRPGGSCANATHPPNRTFVNKLFYIIETSTILKSFLVFSIFKGKVNVAFCKKAFVGQKL